MFSVNQCVTIVLSNYRQLQAIINIDTTKLNSNLIIIVLNIICIP